MKLNIVLVIFTFLLTSSCSFFQASDAHRSIAAEIQSPTNIDEIFTIKTSNYIDNTQDFLVNFRTFVSPKDIEIKLLEDSGMSPDVAFKIVPVIEDQSYKIYIFHKVDAKLDGDASFELINFLRKIIKDKYTNPISIFELYYNAKSGDFQSLQALAKIRLLTYGETPEILLINKEIIDREIKNVNYWKEINVAFAKEEKKFNKQTKAQDNIRKEIMDILDKVTEDKQFRNLVANNDREGAAALIKQYLPWHEMPPFEKLFWENHLKFMADPLPIEDRVLIYRGIDDDIIQVAEDAGKKLTREEATREQKIFLMSTMMTKNQGTWNRRLRSLTAMYEKFMGTDNNGSTEFTKAARITNMFFKHSIQPKGSPFLSYTPSFFIASRFGAKKNTAYFMDPRMIYFNYASGFFEEEFLLPIISFPDDLAAVYDSKVHETVGNVKDFLKEESLKRLTKEFNDVKASQVYERIEKNSEKYFSPVAKGQTGAVKVKVDGVIDKNFVSMFKKLQTQSAVEVKKVINDKQNMTCLDLIQLFWK